jgi:hypothetical protein
MLLLLFLDCSGLSTWLLGLIDLFEPLLSKIRVLRLLTSLGGKALEELKR